MVALAVVSFLGCANLDPTSTTLEPLANPPRFSHIHGLGIDPAEGTLYAATHTGLYRIDGDTPTIVANRYQDTMGFAVMGPKHFIASGHPDMREELPVLLGLIESKDAGITWAKRSRLGESDFHVLRTKDERIWGYDATASRILVTSDGKSWKRSASILLSDFVVSPSNEDVLIAANGEALRRSDDDGETWGALEGPPKPLFLSWARKNELWVMTTNGDVFRGHDDGSSWLKRGSAGLRPGAFLLEGEALYAASEDRVVMSDDEGRSWKTLYSEQKGR
jgi:photosystem II stability/assembly factor-like uncharacterized protein